MVRQKKLQGQLPMEFMLPATDWVPPTDLPDFAGHGDLVIDVETRDDGLAAGVGPAWYRRGGWVAGFSVTSEHQSVYVPVRHPDTECVDHETAGRYIRHIMALPGQRKIAQNSPYDLGWLWAEWGVPSPTPEELEDTLAMAFCLDEDRLNYRLGTLCAEYDVPGKDESLLRAAAEAYGFDPKKELWKLPARFVAPYGMQDGVSTLGILRKMEPQIDACSLREAYNLERDLIPLTVEMQRRGIRVNTEQALRTQQRLFDQADACFRKLEDYVQNGRKIGMDEIRSPKWMGDVFRRLEIPIPSTDKGNDSFSNEWMSKYEGPHREVPNLCAKASLYYDAANKFIGKYILEYTHNGRIHAVVNQFRGEDEGGTVTTRYSYSDPPLQQMPSRVPDVAIDIRSCFEAEEGEVWAAEDYSQQEYRLIVHFAYACDIVGADVAVQMYQDNPDTDFHQLVVELTGLPRRRAKDCNFAKAFGAGIPKFAAMTGMSEEEAKEKMGIYDEKVPFVKRLAEYCQKIGDSRGYVKMIDGFRGRFETWEPRWLPYKVVNEKVAALRAAGKPAPDLGPCSWKTANIRTHDPDHPWYGQRLKRAKTHKSMNKVVQGSAARQMKKAMRQAWREGIVPMIQMHDELGLSVPPTREGRQRAERLAEIMETVVQLYVPVKVDVEYGSNWGRAAKDERTGHKPTWEAALADLGVAA